MVAGELYLLFTEPLERLGLTYMVTGSVASSSYGEPRFTHDIDVVVALPSSRAASFGESFPLETFYCPPASRERGGHFNLIHHETGFKADVYLTGADPLHGWALGRRLRVAVLPDRELWLAPPEYVIVRKVQWFADSGGERHLRDIRTMLEVSRDVIDQDALHSWVERLDLRSVWARVGP